MDIQKLPIDQLIPAKYNPRKDLKPGDPAYEKLKRSIEEFGYVEPVILNKQTGNVVGGHQRIKVLKQMGFQEVDCVVVDLGIEKEKALNLTMNKVTGEWDIPLLTDLLRELESNGFDTSFTGFDKPEIIVLLGEPDANEDGFNTDGALAAIKTPITKQGDIWVLGKHRLVCGDSTSSDVLTQLMAGMEADLVLTDPPYNVDYEGGTKKKLKIQNDKMQDGQFLIFLTDAFTRMYEHSKKGAAIYVFHADSEGFNFRSAFKRAGYSLRQCLIWVKNSLVMGQQDYQWKHEPILYGWKDGAGHSWYSDRKQTTLVEFDRPHKSPDHPTMKPVGLCGYFIKNSSKEGDIILDPFGGSGSILIACEQMSRICYTVELDPKYCDVIVKRFAEHTHSSADVFLLRGDQKIPLVDLSEKQSD